MVGPIDYRLQVLDPIQGYLKGIGFAEDLKTAQLGREQTRQSMGIQAAQEARAAQQFEMQRAEAARKQAEAQRGQQVLSDLFNNPSPTSNDFTRAYVANPAIREEIKFLMQNQSEGSTKAQLSAAQNIYAAASNGNIPVLERVLTEQRDVMRNSGNEQLAKVADEGLRMLKNDPSGAVKMLRTSTGLSIIGFGGDIEKINKVIGIPEPAKPTEAMRTLDAQLRAGGIVPRAEGGDGRYETAMASAAGVGGGKDTETIRTLKDRAEMAGLVPGTPEFQEFMRTGGKEGGPLVQTIIGDAEGTLAKELAKKDAARISATIDAGATASRNLVQIDTLSALLGEIKTGQGAAVKSWLGETFGIATEGLDEIQAFQSAVSRLIPAQREEGSGSSSDLDVKMFARGLPNLINQPGGNEIIVETLREINQYDIAASLIAGKVADWAMTPEAEREDLEARGLILSPSQARQAIVNLGSATPTYKKYLESRRKGKPEPAASGDEKSDFMADPIIQRLSPELQESAWEIYKQKVSR